MRLEESLESTEERIAGSRGELWKLLKEEEACLTTEFNNFPKVQVEDLVLFQRFSMSQRTILVAQAAHFLDLIMKFKTSPMMRKTKLRKTKLMQKLQRNKLEIINTHTTNHTSSRSNVFNLLLERQFKRSLECFVGARELEMDYRLVTPPNGAWTEYTCPGA
ncbi:hypothetical protein Tco_1467940 [Tanacetum coccineum]